mgnify:CR=1 FL=1|tara:strand:- start:3129 stop:3686 length:558 start_codon:yes stop_codon:yes gene_type:complete
MTQVTNDLARKESRMEMTPMIDVTFLLLIFFMCTLKFKVLEGKLSSFLPKDVGVSNQTSMPVEKVEVIVRVVTPGTKLRADGRGPFEDASGSARHVWNRGDPSLGEQRVLEYAVMGFRTTSLDEAGQRLAAIRELRSAFEDDIPLTLDPREGLVYGDVTPLLDTALEAGFEDITFVGRWADHLNR